MSVIDEICIISRAACPRIVMSEGEDPRIIEASKRAAADGLAHMILVGNEAAIRERLGEGDAEIEIIDPATSAHTETYAEAYYELRKARGADMDKARATMSSGLGFAAMMVRQGDADGTIGGAVATTADTVRAALQVIGKAPEADVVSSCFLMLLKEPFQRPVIFADCGLVPQPDAAALASIATASAGSLEALTGLEPKVAMLSFSTMGSVAKEVHESIGRIGEAMDLVRQRAPDLSIDGEMQFDAAIIPDVAATKAPGSSVAGSANVFVFPSLSAGNIGYKIAQRIGGAIALGPILQGLAKPANDLSRGCSAEDVYPMIAITGAQAAAQKTQ